MRLCVWTCTVCVCVCEAVCMDMYCVYACLLCVCEAVCLDVYCVRVRLCVCCPTMKMIGERLFWYIWSGI